MPLFASARVAAVFDEVDTLKYSPRWIKALRRMYDCHVAFFQSAYPGTSGGSNCLFPQCWKLFADEPVQVSGENNWVIHGSQQGAVSAAREL